jgi:putative hydrolase of the HAD superfamily
MKLVLVFDLDDTLYTEHTFVESGFRAVAKFLKNEWNIPFQKSYNLMLLELKKGRGSIFNNVLKRFNVFSNKNLQKCISIYRTHFPDIILDKEGKNCLKRFNDFPKYLVTDGNKIAQGNKVKALGLEKIMCHCFVTHRYGIKHAKPSAYCFLKISNIEKVNSKQVVYIADNPNKDFVGIKPLGFKTIRILKGPFKDVKFDRAYDAEFKIKSLNQLTNKFLKTVFK